MRSGESAGRIQSSLSRLRAKGLVSRLWGRSPRWTATNPGTAIRSLVRDMQSELDLLTDTADELEAAFRDVGTDPAGGDQFEVLAGPEEQARWYVRLQQEAKEEVLTFDRPPYVLDYHNPLQTDLLRNGVRYRTTRDLQLHPLARGGDVGHPPTHLLQQLQLPLVGVVKGLARILHLVQGLVGLGLEDHRKSLHHAHARRPSPSRSCWCQSQCSAAALGLPYA